MAGARMRLTRKKNLRAKNPARRWGAPDKSNQLSRLVARARGRCLAANSGYAGNRSGGGESTGRIIAPALQGEGELVHRAHAQKNPARSGARRIIPTST